MSGKCCWAQSIRSSTRTELGYMSYIDVSMMIPFLANGPSDPKSSSCRCQMTRHKVVFCCPIPRQLKVYSDSSRLEFATSSLEVRCTLLRALLVPIKAEPYHYSKQEKGQCNGEK